MSDATRGRLGLILLWGVPLGLMFGAWLLYVLNFAPGTHNHGELIQPPVAVGEALPATPADARQWSLLLPAPADGCGDDCRESLRLSRQVHIALGRDAWRLRRVHWNSSGEAVTSRRRRHLGEEHPGMLTLDDGTAVLNQRIAAAVGPDWSGKIYLVDPDGFLMMRYESEQAGEDILEDLRFLLKISRRFGE